MSAKLLAMPKSFRALRVVSVCSLSIKIFLLDFLVTGVKGGGLPLHPVASVDCRATQSVVFCLASAFFLFSVVVAAAADVFVIGKSGL